MRTLRILTFLDYNLYPEPILASILKFKSAFLYKYPDLDAVLRGENLIDRPTYVTNVRSSLLIMNVSPKCKVKAGDHVFIGATRVKGVAKAYVHSREGNQVFIGSMSSHLEE